MDGKETRVPHGLRNFGNLAMIKADFMTSTEAFEARAR